MVTHKHDEETHQAISGLLRKAWIDVLGESDSDTSTDDDLFQQGGNSMRAMEMVAATRRQGLSITVGKIFGNPVFDHLVSVTSISRRAQSNGYQGEQDGLPKEAMPFALLGPDKAKEEALNQAIAQCRCLNESDVEDILPATPLQTDFMTSGIRRLGTFVAQTWIAIPSYLIIDIFQKVWKQLSDSFPTLRCRMVNIGPIHNCTADEDFLVLLHPRRLLDWAHVEAGTELDNYLTQDRATPMGYGDALVRYAILDSSINGEEGQNNTMVLTMHQCIYDGFTVKRLHQALNELLNHQNDSTPLLPTPSFSPFIEHITAQRDRHDTKHFWQDYFAGYVDFAGYGAIDGALAKQQSPFPVLPESSCEIEADSLFATNIQTPTLGPNLKHITVPTIVLAGWALVMNHYTGDTDIVLPMHVSGRGLPVPGIMDVAFPAIAGVPVRIQLPTDLLNILARYSEEKAAVASSSPGHRKSLKDFLQKLQADQIQLGTTAVSHAGLDAISAYSEPCRQAVDVCRRHPQGSLDIQYAPAKFRPEAKKQGPDNDSLRINVEMQVNVQDVKYFSPEDALSLGCYILDGGVVRLVFVYDSKIVRKEQITEYSTKLESFIRALVCVLGGDV